MSGRAWFYGTVFGLLTWAVLIVLFLWLTPAHAGPAAAPCRTRDYRTRVVNVLGTSEDLLAATNGAYKALKTGHRKAGMAALKSVHDYLPTYFDRESRLMKLTVGCGT